MQTLTGAAMLLAISVVLSFVGSLRISDTPIGRSLDSAILGAMYGPLPRDCRRSGRHFPKYLIKPTGQYFFGFTHDRHARRRDLRLRLLQRALYRRTCHRFKTLVSGLLNILLNTFRLTILYGQPFTDVLAIRTIKNVTLLPLRSS